jgi:rod shape-determining protein MreC
LTKSSKDRTFVMVIVFVILLTLLAVVTASRIQSMTVAESALGRVLSPVKSIVYDLTSRVYGYFADFGERRAVFQRYEDLSRRVSELEQELTGMSELERENERLKALLNFAEQVDRFTFAGGGVTGKDPGNWFNTFTIDAGSASGIEKDMAVVNEDGLLGRVFDVGYNWAKVRTIIDGRSAVSGMIERTRDNGLIRGNNRLGFEDGLLRMIYLPLDTEIVVGDKVLTSGLDGIFPKGLVIGEIKEILGREHELYVSAIIKPAADFRRLEEVLVIKHEQAAADS